MAPQPHSDLVQCDSVHLDVLGSENTTVNGA